MGGIAAGAGRRCLGVEQERTAEPLRDETHLCEVEIGDSACEAHLLPLLGQRTGERQRHPQGRIPVGEGARKTVVFQIRLQPDAAEVVTAVLRMVDLRPEARPGPGFERVESGAPGGQREVEHPQRVGRQEAAGREAVAPELGVVALLPGIETPVQNDAAGIDGKCRGDRECAPVGPGRAAKSDPVGDRHPAAQGRIGQQLHEEGHVAEVAFETGRSVQRFGVEEVLRPAVGGEVEVPGRRYVETDPADVGQGSRRGQFHPDRAVVQRRRDRRRAEIGDLTGVQVGGKRGGERRAGLRAQDAGSGRNVGPEPGAGGSEFESGERNACRAHFEPSARVAHRKSAAFGERQLPELQGDVGAPVVDRVDPQVECREGDERRVESRGRAVAQRAVLHPVVGQRDTSHPHGPRQGGRRVGGFGRRFGPGTGRGGQVGADAAVEQHAPDADLLAVEPDAALLDRAVGKAYREFGHRGCGPHPEGGVQYRDFPDVERPGRRSRAVGLFRRGRCLQAEEDVAVGECDPGDAGPLGPEVGPGLPEREQSGGEAHIQTSRGVFVAGRDPVQFETADDDLFPDQRPQGHVQREPAAIDERVGPVDQQRLFDRQPEREGEADAADRKVHAERLGGVADRLAPDEILNGRNVEQRGGEQHRQQDDEQCPKRIFYDFSQHVHNERFRLPQNSSR